VGPRKTLTLTRANEGKPAGLDRDRDGERSAREPTTTDRVWATAQAVPFRSPIWFLLGRPCQQPRPAARPFEIQITNRRRPCPCDGEDFSPRCLLPAGRGAAREGCTRGRSARFVCLPSACKHAVQILTEIPSYLLYVYILCYSYMTHLFVRRNLCHFIVRRRPPFRSFRLPRGIYTYTHVVVLLKSNHTIQYSFLGFLSASFLCLLPSPSN
jgi:hypothetical protein